MKLIAIQTRLSRIPRLFGAEAMAVYPWLLVVPARKDDEALIAHEHVHLDEQKAMGRWTWWWKYLTCKAFRQNAEVDAYKAQLEVRPDQIKTFAKHLSEKYFLDITQEDALKLLQAPAN